MGDGGVLVALVGLMAALRMPLLWALGLSLAAAASLGWLWLDARDELAAAVTQRDSARAAASACSDATDDLRQLADRRAAEAAAAQRQARAVALEHQRRAQQILSMPASQPGNDCASARDRVDDWLQGRARP